MTRRPRCGAKATDTRYSRTPGVCRMQVKVEGQRCYHHRGQPKAPNPD